jgi:hypothetical protein
MRKIGGGLEKSKRNRKYARREISKRDSEMWKIGWGCRTRQAT